MTTRARVAALVLIAALALSACAGGATQSKEPVKADPIRVAASKLILKPGSDEPKVVIGLYEDFLCPACGQFEKSFGPAVRELMTNGSAAVDYYMVAILDRQANQNYSSRASAAGYCVADADTSPDKQAFQRFHAALYAEQPNEAGSTFPTDDELIETARQSDADISACVKDGRHLALAKGLAAATVVTSTPTIRINGEDYAPSTPSALTDYVKKLAG